MTNTEAIAILKKLFTEITKDYDVLEADEIEAFNMAISSLEHQCPVQGECSALIELLPTKFCEDAISRKAVEEITWEEPSYTDALNVLTEVRDKVRALPSVSVRQE